MAHDINAIKKCLKDAGLYEENMDTKVMVQYYNAIKNSESTANEEDVVRRNSTGKQLSSPSADLEGSDIVNGGLELEESDIEEPAKPAPKNKKFKKEVMNFTELPVSTEKMLEVVYHEPKFSLAINFNSDVYKNLSLPHKVGLLYQYHTNLSKQMNDLARLSLHSTPRPKDIQTSAKFCDSLRRSSCENYDFSEQSTESIYTSRSGRQTKRKKYIEDIDFEEELRNKKHKNDEDDWAGKKTKITEKKSIPQTQTSETQKSIPKQDTRETQSPNVTQTSLNTPSTSKCENPTPIQRRSNLKKLSNEEIMKRSSLFSPISGKRSRGDSRTRSEQLFDKLKDEEVKNQIMEREREIFEESLKHIIELEDMPEHIESPDVVSSTPSPPKKITGRRAINARKRLTPEVTEPDSTKKSTKSSPKGNANRSFLKNTSINPHIDIDAIESEVSGEQAQGVKKIDCPLCGVGYPEEEIEEHASNCCEPIDTSQSQITLRSSVKS